MNENTANSLKNIYKIDKSLLILTKRRLTFLISGTKEEMQTLKGY